MKSRVLFGVGILALLMLSPDEASADPLYDLPQGFSDIEVGSCSNLPPVARNGEAFYCLYKTVGHVEDEATYFVFSNSRLSGFGPRNWLIAGDFSRSRGTSHGIEVVSIIFARDEVRIVHGPESQPLVLAVNLQDTEHPQRFFEIVFEDSPPGQSDWRLAPYQFAPSADSTGQIQPLPTLDVSGGLYECEVTVSRANVRDAARGAITSILQRGAVVYLYRRMRTNGAVWYEVLTFNSETQEHVWLGVMAASTLNCWGVPERIPDTRSGIVRDFSF